MCILKKIAMIQRNLMTQDIPKSGYNKFGNFHYHELEDLLPPITKECFDQELILLFDFTDTEAILKITNWNDAKDFVSYTVPMPPIVEMNKKMNIMQSEGSYITYLKKYLLVNAFLIMEKSTVEQIPFEDDSKVVAPKKEEKRVNDEPLEVPNCISKALQRITSKGVEINRKTVYAHVNWKQISDDEKLAAKEYINRMEA
ncbi:MAG: ERF family protein [Methanobrevibacter sp.]|nr:ERF family protein [Methanobrevibacter sp.]MBQ6627396.1 ERF family protein [Methanobrevibacter sp.]